MCNCTSEVWSFGPSRNDGICRFAALGRPDVGEEGVDFDGNGHVDLRHSVPDVLASTANLLHTSGFKNGAPYGEGTANFEAMRGIEPGISRFPDVQLHI